MILESSIPITVYTTKIKIRTQSFTGNFFASSITASLDYQASEEFRSTPNN